MKAPRHDDDCRAAPCIFCGDTMVTMHERPGQMRVSGPCRALVHQERRPGADRTCDCGLVSELRRLYDAGFADGSHHDGQNWRGDEVVGSLLAAWSGR